MLYITDFICTYKLMDNDFDKEHLYRIQMLQAFGLEQWDSVIIQDTMTTLYDKLKDDEQFRRIIDDAKISSKIGNSLPIYNDSMVFTMLFNYDFFDMMHKCICENINTNFIKRETFEKIMDSF